MTLYSLEEVEALEDSIAHWEDNAKVTQPYQASLSSKACALCEYSSRYPNNEIVQGDDVDLGDCAACPVAKHTGEGSCSGTPYVAAHRALRSWLTNVDSLACLSSFQAAAQQEVDFLRFVLNKQQE